MTPRQDQTARHLLATANRVRMLWRSVGVCAALWCVSAAWANSPPPDLGPPPCTGSARPICQALSIRDARRRTEEARRAFERAFSPTGADAVIDVLRTVMQLKEKVDFRPFEDIFERECKRSSDRCVWSDNDKDLALLRHGSRQERIDLLATAIRTGSAELPHGLKVERPWAVRLAATTGLAELRPLAEQYLSVISETRKKRHQLTTIGDMFDLCGGAPKPEDAPRLAIGRLHSMRPEDLARRWADPAFQTETLKMVRRACWPDPWSTVLTGAVAPECCLLSDITRRQRRLRSHDDLEGPAFNWCCETGCGDWLSELECVAWRASESYVLSGNPNTEVGAFAAKPGDSRRGGLDPCSLPDVPSREQWGGGSFQARIGVLERRDGSAGELINRSVGLLHHRTGERVRLRIDISDKQGNAPDWPVVVEISLVGNRGGTISGAGGDPVCRALRLLWNTTSESGNRVPAQREFELVLGSDAGVAGFLPSDDPTAALTPWWRQAARLHVAVGRILDAGDRVGKLHALQRRKPQRRHQ